MTELLPPYSVKLGFLLQAWDPTWGCREFIKVCATLWRLLSGQPQHLKLEKPLCIVIVTCILLYCIWIEEGTFTPLPHLPFSVLAVRKKSSPRLLHRGEGAGVEILLLCLLRLLLLLFHLGQASLSCKLSLKTKWVCAGGNKRPTHDAFGIL